MKVFQKTEVYLFICSLFILAHGVNAYAGIPIYAAVQTGGSPGIWLLEDKNGDGDALDPGEKTPFATEQGFTDVAVDGNGVLYAIEEETGTVFIIEDLNDDGDAEDSGEVKIFRDDTALGLHLKDPVSIAVANHFDPNTLTFQAYVYVTDLVLQRTVRLLDRDGDRDAQGSDEICLILENTAETPFTAMRMAVDDLGRIFGANPNNQQIVRLDDMNQDCYVPEPESGPLGPRCPSPGCGPNDFNEYHIIKKTVFGQVNLDHPFGVAISANGDYFVSQSSTRNRVIKLTDQNGDDDALDPGESSVYYLGAAGAAFPGFDLAVDDAGIVYVTQDNSGGDYSIIRLEDGNFDGDANDPGESTTYATFAGWSRPLGLAVQFRPPVPLEITAELLDSSPVKGPLLVVEDGDTVNLKLQVTERASGQPAVGARVGSAALAGCFALCPLSDRTDSDGYIAYNVSRTAESPGGGELLKFWVYGDETLVPVVSSPCTPLPVADTGPDQVIFASQNVTLDGSASTGAALHYCWEQTGGPDVGLPECTETTIEDPDVTFAAPASPATLMFTLHVRNACDYTDMKEVTVEAVSTFTLELNASYLAGDLSLEFHIGSSTQTLWANYLIMTSPTFQILPLWSLPLPSIHPPVDLPLSFPLPDLGMIGIWTGLITGGGVEVHDLKWVDTGASD